MTSQPGQDYDKIGEVSLVCDVADYANVLAELQSGAVRGFAATTHYGAAISQNLAAQTRITAMVSPGDSLRRRRTRKISPCCSRACGISIIRR